MPDRHDMLSGMTQPLPPALAAPRVEFTPEHWNKVPRQMEHVEIEQITNKLAEGEPERVEFRFKGKNGGGIVVNAERLSNREHLHVNQKVMVEHIGQIITGMFVPLGGEWSGWIFRMTSQDLADHTRKMVNALQDHQQRAMANAISVMVDVLRDELTEQLGRVNPLTWHPVKADVLPLAGHELDVRKLAIAAIQGLQKMGPKQQEG